MRPEWLKEGNRRARRAKEGQGVLKRVMEMFTAPTSAVYLDEEPTKTKKISDTSNPDFNHAKLYSFTPATRQVTWVFLIVVYLIDRWVDCSRMNCLVISVMGKQRVRKSAMPRTNGLTTKEMLRSDRAVFAKTANLMNGFQMNGRVVDPQKQSIIVELLLMKKTQARLQQKVDSVRKLVKEAENISKVRVSTSLLKEVLQANTPEQADMIIRKITGPVE
ncbi:hypothetical protein C7M84_007074 [Penaeus vannamei]|uniref:Uncharacterized protein n=1 Tax=Penaeus vannamei TaxID=6689 RepID=A0A423TD74_PENVA|nr:hypothetical protein C7M84_007074 [Penaeus vannamei]